MAGMVVIGLLLLTQVQIGGFIDSTNRDQLRTDPEGTLDRKKRSAGQCQNDEFYDQRSRACHPCSQKEFSCQNLLRACTPHSDAVYTSSCDVRQQPSLPDSIIIKDGVASVAAGTSVNYMFVLALAAFTALLFSLHTGEGDWVPNAVLRYVPNDGPEFSASRRHR